MGARRMTGPTESPGASAASGRPNDYADLLIRPIAMEGGGTSYANWEQDHGSSRSFYVKGFRWFLHASQIDDFNRIAPFSAAAVELVAKRTNWTSMPESGTRWNECGSPQFKRARHRGTTYFQKAALIIVACELALEQRIKDKLPLRTQISMQDIYQHMGVIPACWHIEEFTPDQARLLKAQYPEAELALKTECGQEARTFIDHLANGYSTTFETAKKTRDYIATNCKKVTVGRVSPMPGRLLGVKGATEFETIDSD